MKKMFSVLVVTMLWLAAHAGAAAEGAPAAPKVFPRLPVKEVTVFKDGHALVVQEGQLPTTAAGDVELDRLPAPVLGTFWPYALPGATLKGASAGRRRVSREHTALTMAEMIEANPGAEVMVSEKGTGMTEGRSYPATIVGIPTRSAEELEATGPDASRPVLPQKSTFVMLKVVNGTLMVPLERIQELTFKQAPVTRAAEEEIRNLLTLRLEWGGSAPAKKAGVGLAYVQKGLRWIPSYKIDLDGAGKATVKFQATLVNELADLDGATANLVIGVPNVAFKDLTDPIALSEAMSRLSQAFRPDNAYLASNSLSFSNAIQTQAALPSEQAGRGALNLGPEIPGGNKAEDLYIFTVKGVTLKRGGSLVLPVAEFTMKYEDLYTLEIPETPPKEIGRSLSNTRQAELARLLNSPKVMHKIRLVNGGSAPLTTAPALLMRGGQMLAQALLPYTAPGATTEVELGTVVDIEAKPEDKETRRTPNAERWEGETLARIDLAGTIRLVNHRGAPVKVEVSRYVLGEAASADQQGTMSMVDVLGDSRGAGDPSGVSGWWHDYAWPTWWAHFNGRGRIVWQKTLEPEKPVTLNYTWHYIWR